jgi:hypothetical protein
VIEIKTSIPKGRIFIFENYWMSYDSFMPLVANCWNGFFPQQDVAKLLTAKFKFLRNALKTWQSQISNLKITIENIKLVISFLDAIEECRDQTLQEWNFRDILNLKLSSLLHQQMIYWEQRGTVKWVKLGDENSKFFHAIATIKHRRNLITSLSGPSGGPVFNHNAKAELIWSDFKERLGSSNFQCMHFDFESLFGQSPDLSYLEEPISSQKLMILSNTYP